MLLLCDFSCFCINFAFEKDEEMKRVLFICLTVCLFTIESHAQWRVGASAGTNYNWYTINTHYQTDYHYQGAWGWNAALFGQYDFLPWVGLRAEIEASERNYNFYRTGIYAGTNYVLHNTYVHLPVMAQLRFGGTQVIGYLNLGVYAGYWAASRYKGTQFDALSWSIVAINQDYAYQKEKDQRADFGLAGGLGLEYRFFDHWAVHIEGRLYYSFISTVKPYMLIKDSRYNTTVGLQAGFSYIF